MKLLALSIFLFAATAIAQPVVPGHYSGGFISSKCPGFTGGQINIDVIPGPAREAVVRIIDDGVVIYNHTVSRDERNRFVFRTNDLTLIGRLYPLKNTNFVFKGVGADDNCRYKFQGHYRRPL